MFVGFETLLIESQMRGRKKFIWCNLSVWMVQQNSVDTNKFRSILNNFGVKTHLNKATHNLRHTLDLVTDFVEKFYSCECKYSAS